MITVIRLLISKNGLLPSPSVIPNCQLTMYLQPNCVDMYEHFTTPHTFPLYLSHPSMMWWLFLDLKHMPITTLDDLYDYYDFSLNESWTTDSQTCLRSTFKPHYISESNLNLNLVGGPYRFLINLIMFPCKYCAEWFTALFARGLTQHHRKCQAFLKHEAKANQCRKTTVASNKNRQTNSKP